MFIHVELKTKVMMKRCMISLFAGSAIFYSTVVAANPTTQKQTTYIGDVEVTRWTRVDNGVWKCTRNGVDFTYRVNSKGVLEWTVDGSKWSSEESYWFDFDGKMITLKDGKLMSSTDHGRNWTEIPTRRWKTVDGKTYEFDQDWVLWAAVE